MTFHKQRPKRVYEDDSFEMGGGVQQQGLFDASTADSAPRHWSVLCPDTGPDSALDLSSAGPEGDSSTYSSRPTTPRQASSMLQAAAAETLRSRLDALLQARGAEASGARQSTANGTLVEGQGPVTKKRRGRKKNVEGFDMALLTRKGMVSNLDFYIALSCDFLCVLDQLSFHLLHSLPEFCGQNPPKKKFKPSMIFYGCLH